MTDYNSFWRSIAPIYGTLEAKAIARLAFLKCCGLTFTDICGCKDSELSKEKQQELNKIIQRLQKKEPIQYILKRVDFCGKEFCISPGVLIPRPETEELVMKIIGLNSQTLGSPRSNMNKITILDACTGSGCIAISLALALNNSEVWAFDISGKALQLAKENADNLKANVNIFKADALNLKSCEELKNKTFDIIVSNPPYVCESEKQSMEENVFNYEPHEALFVEDNKPLVFYESIAEYAINHLNEGGNLWFEINPLLYMELQEKMLAKNFKLCEILIDSFEKNRFCCCKI